MYNLTILGTVILDFQTDILNYAGQQAIAHAALIFATLTAVFTFAAAFHGKLTDWPRPTKVHGIKVYYSFLLGMFSVASYALFRLIMYARLVTLVLSNPPSKDMASLSAYYHNITLISSAQSAALAYVGGLNTVGLFASLIAASVLAYFLLVLVERPQSWKQCTELWWATIPISSVFVAVVGLFSAWFFHPFEEGINKPFRDWGVPIPHPPSLIPSPAQIIVGLISIAILISGIIMYKHEMEKETPERTMRFRRVVKLFWITIVVIVTGMIVLSLLAALATSSS